MYVKTNTVSDNTFSIPISNIIYNLCDLKEKQNNVSIEIFESKIPFPNFFFQLLHNLITGHRLFKL